MNDVYRFSLFMFSPQESFRFFLSFSQALRSIRAALKFTSLVKGSVECTQSIPTVWKILECTVIIRQQAEAGLSFKKDLMVL